MNSLAARPATLKRDEVTVCTCSKCGRLSIGERCYDGMLEGEWELPKCFRTLPHVAVRVDGRPVCSECERPAEYQR